MHTQIEKALYELINQIEIYLNQDKRQGNWLTQAFKTVAYEIVFDSEKFKNRFHSGPTKLSNLLLVSQIRWS